MSWSIPFRAWPMCSSPVTLGGGTAIEKRGLSLAASARKRPASSQRAYQRASTACGSYAVVMEWWFWLIGRARSSVGMGLEAGARGAELAGVRRLGYVRYVCSVLQAAHSASHSTRSAMD